MPGVIPTVVSVAVQRGLPKVAPTPWQSVSSHLNVYSVQRLFARRLAGYLTTINQYLTIVLWATSNQRGRLSIPLTSLLQLVTNRYLLNRSGLRLIWIRRSPKRRRIVKDSYFQYLNPIYLIGRYRYWS
jgi:hypothetical protein